MAECIKPNVLISSSNISLLKMLCFTVKDLSHYMLKLFLSFGHLKKKPGIYNLSTRIERYLFLMRKQNKIKQQKLKIQNNEMFY